jgi:hypothetical protein
MMIIGPQYTVCGNKNICINAKEVVNSIRQCFPQETYKTLADRAKVHIQTIFRWVSIGRAEEYAMRQLIFSFEDEDNYDTVLLKNASPIQLRKQCQLIGWDKVINSPKTRRAFYET